MQQADLQRIPPAAITAMRLQATVARLTANLNSAFGGSSKYLKYLKFRLRQALYGSKSEIVVASARKGERMTPPGLEF
jgi:hypothetical protein